MSINKNPSLSIVLPCFNEEENILNTFDILSTKIEQLINDKLISNSDNQIVFVDDGSSDKTWEAITKLKSNKFKVVGIKFTNNFGHQSALIAGMEYTKTDLVITMDVDLQDNIEVIDKMIEEYLKGNEIVFGVKIDRAADSFIKKLFAKLFYLLITNSNSKQIINHADFRLSSKKVIDHLRNFKEYNLYLRGIFTVLNSNSSIIKYEIKKRKYGKSKYNFSKMFNLALSAITSFSVFPLRLIFFMGLIISLMSTILIIYTFLMYFLTNSTVPGWASIILPIYFLGGLQLLGLGIIAEYISKTYIETKQRPRYLIDKIFD